MKTFDEKRERAEQDGSEYQFGAIQTDLALIPLDQRLKYFPDGVLQFNNIMDTNGCASRAPLQILEAKFEYFYQTTMHPNLKAWVNKIGYRDTGKFSFSDAFTEILSGTTENGNSLKSPLECIRKVGLIPGKYLPLKDQTWSEYMDSKRITEEMYTLGRQFKQRFTINYEQLTAESFLEALKEDMVDSAVHAWPEPVNGVYPKTVGEFNHAVMLGTPDIDAMDNYNPFVKRLAKDYNFFPWGYSLSITAQNPFVEQQVSVLQAIVDFLKKLLLGPTPNLDLVFTTKYPTEQPPEETYQVIKSATEFLHDAVLECIGKDMAKTQDELGCAEAVNGVHKYAFGKEIGGGTSTALLFKALKADKTFQLVTKWEPGVIIISPTGMGDGHGHTGFFTTDGIVSNDSRTGKFSKNFTIDSWVKYYRLQKHFPIYYFKKVV